MQEIKTKKRHGCVTAFLVMIIVGNAIGMFSYIVNKQVLTASVLPDWAPIVLSILALLNIIFAVGLFKLKKWAFWGFVSTTVVLCFLNIFLGTPVFEALAGLAGAALLFGLLHLGKENSGWKQLD